MRRFSPLPAGGSWNRDQWVFLGIRDQATTLMGGGQIGSGPSANTSAPPLAPGFLIP